MTRILASLALLFATTTPAFAQTSVRSDQQSFRALYKELVETNTSYSGQGCTKAATQLQARMKAAGFSDAEAQVIVTPGFPDEGSLVAIMPGTMPKLKPMLLLAHIDVVEAKREDWTRDPYTLIEEEGYFFARGVADDKAQAAIWVDSLIRFKQAGWKPKRTIKLAATCGEESNGVALNGAEWLARNRPELISAAFAINEGGGGRVQKDGKRTLLAMQVGEKATRTFLLQTTNPGGHSSVPRPDNAIYDLTAAANAVQKMRFPVMLNDTTRAFLAQAKPVLPPAAQPAVDSLLANGQDEAAAAILSMDPVMNATLRTTCVTTMLEAGHAPNALPQRAKAIVNCRIAPGMTQEEVQSALEKAVGNTAVKITLQTPYRPMAVPPALNPKIWGPAEQLAKKMFPGVPLVPVMSTGATDATMTGIIGIPTYGVPGIFMEADGGGVHGLNERIRVQSVYDGRDYLHELIKLYASN